jgi:hypothetical protein
LCSSGAVSTEFALASRKTAGISNCYSGSLFSTVQGPPTKTLEAIIPHGIADNSPIVGSRWYAHPRQTTRQCSNAVVVPHSTCHAPSKPCATCRIGKPSQNTRVVPNAVVFTGSANGQSASNSCECGSKVLISFCSLRNRQAPRMTPVGGVGWVRRPACRRNPTTWAPTTSTLCRGMLGYACKGAR